jgi:ribosomal protein L20
VCPFKSKKNKQVKRQKEWFTPSLILLKREFGWHKFSQLQKNPSNPFLRGSFYKCLKTYRKARKSQMHKYNQELIEKLDSLHEQNPKAYWKLLDQLKRAKLNKDNKNELNISLSDWKNHFQVLNNSTDETDQGDEDFINKLVEKEKELDFVITENEIEKAIRSLNNSKASGLSMIINEMVKYDQLTLTPMLCKLFNLVFSSGIYPKIWFIGLYYSFAQI